MTDIISIARRSMLIVAVLAAALGCHQGPPHYGVAPASDQPYPRDDAAAVYRAVLDKLYHSSSESPPVVVLWDSARYITIDCPNWPCPTLPPHKSVISRELVRAFEEATRLTTPLSSAFGFSLPLSLLSDSDRLAMEAVGAPLSDSLRRANSYSEQSPYWLGFRKRFPGAWGFAVFTRVGFDRKREHALVQVMHRCSSSCGHMEDMYLEKGQGNWKVVERMLVGPRGSDWVDVVQRFNSPIGDGRDSLVLGSLRYLGPDAQYLARYHAGTDSLHAWLKDSVARDQLPRRIQGTVTNHQTGTPIAFAQIFVVSAATHPNPSARVVADSLGRYEIRNPPLGGTMLEVQCPGPGHRLGATLDAPGLYVHAAIDTTITMVAPNIAPCWSKRRVHRLQAGWLESSTARYAPYPDSDAAAVYRAALVAMSRSSGKKSPIFVLSDMTHERCIVPDDCGSPKLALLFAQHLVDSATIRDFLRESRKRVTLSSFVSYGPNTIFLTGDERAYLTSEGDPWRESNGAWNPLWRIFREAFPSSAGVTSFTRVGFNPNRTQALVEVGLETREEDKTSPEMILLEKKGAEWHVVRRNVDREVMSGTLKSGRCSPTAEHSGANVTSKVRNLSGEFAITEVETARNEGVRHFGIALDAEARSRAPLNPLHVKVPPSKDFISDPRKGVVFDSVGEKVNGLEVSVITHDGDSSVAIWDGALDGHYKGLTIRRISGPNFFGEWRSSFSYMIELNSNGEMLPNRSGYFCAIRR